MRLGSPPCFDLTSVQRTHPNELQHRRVLRQKLRNARTYEEWKQAALDMDEYLGFNLW